MFEGVGVTLSIGYSKTRELSLRAPEGRAAISAKQMEPHGRCPWLLILRATSHQPFPPRPMAVVLPVVGSVKRLLRSLRFLAMTLLG